MKDLTELFCHVDDFVNIIPNKNILTLENGQGKKSRKRRGNLSLSEMMTIVIFFHMSNYRNFKAFYIEQVSIHLRKEFPKLISYSRFVANMPKLSLPLLLFMHELLGECTGKSFIDSTPIAVCHNKRITRNKVFKELAARGKTSMGWFFGLKLHLVVNDSGEIIALQISKGNVDDRVPVPNLARKLYGKLFGDKGYLSNKLFKNLFNRGVKLVTNIKRSMKQKFILLSEKILLRKRFIIETINDQLKNISQIEHTRHRSPVNFINNLFAGLIAYQLSPKKPTLNLSKKEKQELLALNA